MKINLAEGYVELYLSGSTLKEVAAESGASVMTVHRNLKKKGVLRTPAQSSRIAEAKGRKTPKN